MAARNPTDVPASVDIELATSGKPMIETTAASIANFQEYVFAAPRLELTHLFPLVQPATSTGYQEIKRFYIMPTDRCDSSTITSNIMACEFYVRCFATGSTDAFTVRLTCGSAAATVAVAAGTASTSTWFGPTAVNAITNNTETTILLEAKRDAGSTDDLYIQSLALFSLVHTY